MKHVLLGEKPDSEISAYRLMLADQNLKRTHDKEVYQFWTTVKAHVLSELAHYV